MAAEQYQTLFPTKAPLAHDSHGAIYKAHMALARASPRTAWLPPVRGCHEYKTAPSPTTEDGLTTQTSGFYHHLREDLFLSIPIQGGLSIPNNAGHTSKMHNADNTSPGIESARRLMMVNLLTLLPRWCGGRFGRRDSAEICLCGRILSSSWVSNRFFFFFSLWQTGDGSRRVICGGWDARGMKSKGKG